MLIITIFLYITLSSAQDAPFTSRPLWDLTSKTTKVYTSKEFIFSETSTSPRNTILNKVIKENKLSNYKNSTPAEYTTESSKLFTSKLLPTTESFTDAYKSETNVGLSINTSKVNTSTKKTLSINYSNTKRTTPISKFTTLTSTSSSKFITPASRYVTLTPRFTTVSPFEVTKSITNQQKQYVTKIYNKVYTKESQNPQRVVAPTQTVVYYDNGNQVMTSVNEIYSNTQGNTVYQVAPQNYGFNVGAGNDLQSYNVAVKKTPVGLSTNMIKDGNTYKLVVYV